MSTADGMPTVPASKQLFKCPRCENFKRLTERKGREGICAACFDVEQTMGEALKSTERVDEEDGC